MTSVNKRVICLEIMMCLLQVLFHSQLHWQHEGISDEQCSGHFVLFLTTRLGILPLGLSVTAMSCVRKCLVSMLVLNCTCWKVSMCYTARVKYIWYMYKCCHQEDRYSDAVTQGRTPPPSSNGSCKPIDENPTVL